MNILMVCLGNICRSPLAHGIMDHLVNEERLGWKIDSAGTGDWHVGHAPDRRSVSVAKKYGVDISGQRAQHFTAELFGRYDRIFVMDRQNYEDVLRLASTDEERQKVTLFLEDDIVPDPYYDEAMFEPVFQMIEQRCKELVRTLS